MVAYSLINILIFLIFNYTLYTTTEIPFVDQMDYFMDTLVVMVLVSLVSLSSFSIFRQAMDTLKLELEERRQVEKELERARRQAEAGAQAKMEFLTNMSHEIRTPINGIMGMAELAMDKPLDHDLNNIIRTIDMEADQLMGIINGILDFSKIEAGKLILESVPFDLRALFDQTCASMAVGVRAKPIEFIAFMPPDVPEQLIGDPARLRQVIVNLVSNAAKFTSRGEILVSCKLVRQNETHAHLRFKVKDTGIGISRDKQGTIFESFSQADGSTTRQYGGTGLGTTISKQLVVLMGGTIGLDSEQGKGTEFYFDLRFEKQHGGSEDRYTPEAAGNRDADIRGLNILVAHANPTARNVLEQYLVSFGCLPLMADSGEAAMDILEANASRGTPVDLLIEDIGLASDGNNRGGFTRLPTILMAAMGMQDTGDIQPIGRMVCYLSKPVTKSELAMAIASAAGGEHQPEPVAIKPSPPELKNQGVRILLAEDYPTNQKVTMQYLMKAGYNVTLADNGRTAVFLYKRSDFDLILMDIQMPELDGYQATRQIRDHEAGLVKNGDTSEHGTARVPIIAMTAHAIKGHRETCLAAGMDDYMSKPLKRAALLEMVAKWSGENKSPATVSPAVSETENTSKVPETPVLPLAWEVALAEFDNDKEFLAEVISDFFSSVQVQLARIEKALSEGDSRRIEQEAHAIKGGAANLTASPLSLAARALEEAGREGALENGRALFNTLKNEFGRLKTYVEVFIPSGPAASAPRK